MANSVIIKKDLITTEKSNVAILGKMEELS